MKCIHCKKRIGLFDYTYKIGNELIHDYCKNDYEYEQEKRVLEILKLKKEVTKNARR